MNTHLVSIIVPCYNQAQYLPECLNSVLAQTYQNWECIVVSDGSPDNTEEIAMQYVKKDDRFHFVSKENGGLSSARNCGIRKANGEFILPLDADDYISTDYVALAVDAFEQHPQVKVVYSGLCHFGCINYEDNHNDFNYSDFIYMNQIFCSCLYRKCHYEEIGGYDEEMKHGYEDWEFLLRLIQSNDDVYRIPKICFFYRRKENSMIMQLVESQNLHKQAFFYVYHKHIALYDNLDSNPLFYVLNKSLILIRKNNDNMQSIRASYSYRLGRFLLSPITKAKKLYYKLRKRQ